MSHEWTEYAFSPEGPRDFMDRYVLVAIGDYVNGESNSNQAWPSLKALVGKTRMSDSSVRRAIRSLKKEGYISVVPGDGKRVSRYTLLRVVCQTTLAFNSADTPEAVPAKNMGLPKENGAVSGWSNRPPRVFPQTTQGVPTDHRNRNRTGIEPESTPDEAPLHRDDARRHRGKPRSRSWSQADRENRAKWAADQRARRLREERAASEARAGMAAPETPEASAARQNEQQQLAANHFENVSAALRESPIAEEVCQSAADQVSGLDASDWSYAEEALVVIEERVAAAVAAAAPAELVASCKQQAVQELRNYRGRVSPAQLERFEQQSVNKQLFAYYGLPRLSLFYTDQSYAPPPRKTVAIHNVHRMAAKRAPGVPGGC